MPKMGRPLMFKSPEELQAKIDTYFFDCEVNEIPLTITGLALAIGTSRRVLCEYGRREEFGGIVETAKSLVEMDYELALRRNGKAGEIFALKNFGWKDSHQIQGDKDNPVQSKLTLEAGPGIQGTIAALGVAQLTGPSGSDTDGDTQ